MCSVKGGVYVLEVGLKAAFNVLRLRLGIDSCFIQPLQCTEMLVQVGDGCLHHVPGVIQDITPFVLTQRP
ncbi:hypothetical protein CTI14_20005 [Methylobacterium radiotolerans]|nr:hypothetical protein CTI14_20005 [Methylobacterium radiotolerans]